MSKVKLFLLSSIAVLFMILAVSLTVSAQSGYPSGYAEDRAQIEDLQARYMLAIDFNDAETLAALFTEKGTLQTGNDPLTSAITGRAAILESTKQRAKKAMELAAKDTSGMWPVADRHFVSNLVLKVDGDKATGIAYWGHIGNATPDRKPVYVAYGHYTDDFVKVNGKWFFSYRKMTVEQFKTSYTKTSVNPAP